MASNPAPRLLATATVCAVAALTACSSSTTPAGELSTGSSSQATTTSATSTTRSSASSAAVAAGDHDSTFCQAARSYQAQSDKQSAALAGGSPAALERIEKQAAAALPVFESLAPAQLRPAVAQIVAADQKLLHALEAVHWNLRKLPRTTLAAFDTPQLQRATQQVSNYLTGTCKIKIS